MRRPSCRSSPARTLGLQDPRRAPNRISTGAAAFGTSRSMERSRHSFTRFGMITCTPWTALVCVPSPTRAPQGVRGAAPVDQQRTRNRQVPRRVVAEHVVRVAAGDRPGSEGGEARLVGIVGIRREHPGHGVVRSTVDPVRLAGGDHGRVVVQVVEVDGHVLARRCAGSRRTPRRRPCSSRPLRSRASHPPPG